MDHDVMHRDVAGLKQFRARAEKAIAFIEGLQAAGYKPPGDAGAALSLTDEQKSQISALFAEIIKPTTAAIDGKLNSYDDRIRSVESGVGSAADTSQRLAALEQLKSQSNELVDRMTVMLDWFEANRDGLEILLTLDGDVDQDEAQGTNTAGTANAGAAGVTGAGSGPSGTDSAGTGGVGSDGPNPQTGTSTGPGSVEGLPGISQDPSADASIAVDQPAAKT